MESPAHFTLLAEAKPANRTEPFLQKTEDWISVGLLVGTLLAGAVILMLVERWRKRTQSTTQHDGALQLTQYRNMLTRGEITAEEYEKLRHTIAERVKPTSTALPSAESPERKPPTG